MRGAIVVNSGPSDEEISEIAIGFTGAFRKHLRETMEFHLRQGTKIWTRPGKKKMNRAVMGVWKIWMPEHPFPRHGLLR